MSEHLILCGNKTDPCPVCHRFIRRAIFAYHFENKCAKLDESNDYDKPKSNSSDARQTSKMIIYLSSILKNSFFQETSQIIRCEFCRKDCYQEDYDQHKVREFVDREIQLLLNFRCRKSVLIVGKILPVPIKVEIFLIQKYSILSRSIIRPSTSQ